MINKTHNSNRFGSKSRAAVLGLALALVSTAGFAAGTAEQRQACTGDVFRLCASDIPSVDRIVACLKRERAQLSPACRSVFGTETASAPASPTRSITESNSDWCKFGPEHTSQEHQHWKGWCGPATR